MAIKFEKQQYQTDCVNNIIEILKEQDLKSFYNEHPEIPVKNIKDTKNFDILMETGTGKTFTYIKAIFEINKKLFKNKFIIFVPRKAIKEGVIQNINLTSNYFYDEYDGKRLSLYKYDGKESLVAIQNFITSKDELSVLLLTNSSVDKKDNILNQSSELFPESTLKEIAKKEPIIIIDEPHLLKGEQFNKNFKNNFAECVYLRFGATFPKEKEFELSNVIYVLDSINAFQQNLVKKILVHTIYTNENNFKLSKIKNGTAYFKEVRDNIEYEIKKIKGDSIGTATITKIDKNKVYLSSGEDREVKTSYKLQEHDLELMIQKTIDEHFKKERELFDKNIKCLSLFFIENIASFESIKKIFIEKYKEIRQDYYSKGNDKYKEFLARDFENEDCAVIGSYFANSDKKDPNVDLILKDKEKLLSFGTSTRFLFTCWALQEGWDNPNVFNICKLSNTSAEISKRQQVGRGLRLCVNQNGTRQTINCLNEDEFYKTNSLNVIISGYENDFIETIQKEIQETSYVFYGDIITTKIIKEKFGFNEGIASRIFILLEDNNIVNNDGVIQSDLKEFVSKNRDKFNFLSENEYNTLKNKITNNLKLITDANKPLQMVKIKQDKIKEWQELWTTINRKAKMSYKNIKEEELIKEIASLFNREKIEPLQAKIIVKEYDPIKNEIINKEYSNIGNEYVFLNNNKKLYKFFIDFCRENKLCFNFIVKIYNLCNKDYFNNNPQKAKERLLYCIKEKLHDGLINCINYDFENDVIICPFDKTEIKSGDLGRYEYKGTKNNYLYESFIYDSGIEKEIEMEGENKINNSTITIYGKLPKINIPTPYKTYNPDFAYFIERENDKKLFLVVESKGYNNENDIPKEEKLKIKYGEKFFKCLQESVKDIEIVYKQRINKQKLIDILK